MTETPEEQSEIVVEEHSPTEEIIVVISDNESSVTDEQGAYSPENGPDVHQPMVSMHTPVGPRIAVRAVTPEQDEINENVLNTPPLAKNVEFEFDKEEFEDQVVSELNEHILADFMGCIRPDNNYEHLIKQQNGVMRRLAETNVLIPNLNEMLSEFNEDMKGTLKESTQLCKTLSTELRNVYEKLQDVRITIEEKYPHFFAEYERIKANKGLV
ncbi:hypothetical protein PCE1_001704 [Barthelona sp. PCE]